MFGELIYPLFRATAEFREAKMASGATKMSSFNYFQNGKYGTLQQKDMEVSQDLHLKMSKKIAQLTKVWQNW